MINQISKISKLLITKRPDVIKTIISIKTFQKDIHIGKFNCFQYNVRNLLKTNLLLITMILKLMRKMT